MPGGKAISFLAKRGKEKYKSIYTIPLGGGESTCVIAWTSDITSYSYSPEGKRVAFVAADPGPDVKDKDKLYKQEVYEENVRPSKLWVRNLEDANPGDRELHISGPPQAVKWSPEKWQGLKEIVDDRIAISIAPTPLVDDVMMKSKIIVLNAVTGKLSGTIEHSGKLGSFVWNVDGNGIAFIGSKNENDPHAGRPFIVYTGDDPTGEGGVGKPIEVERDWLDHADVQQIYFHWQWLAGAAAILDEGIITKLVHGVGQTGLQPGLFDRDASLIFLDWLDPRRRGIYEKQSVMNAWAALAQSSQFPTELFVSYEADQKQNIFKRLTISNPELNKSTLALQEVVEYKARDGLELQGILIRPLDEEKGKQYPLIVVVHGGPEAHNRNGWLTNYSNPGQVAAARGYAVFYPNYRGSTGRGVEFSKMGQGDPAGKEFDDIVDGVDYLIKTGLVNKDKVGITGGSYGGYATAWCCTKYSDRFAAGVMFVGISDVVSKLGTTDIPNEEYLVHARKHVWEDYEFFLKRSPIYYADQCKTPLLIMGGKDDPRVDPSQSKELYRYLKLRGKAPVRLVQYPGEQHGNQKAYARLDFNLRMMQWFDHYLKGPGGDPPPPDISHDDPDAASKSK
ncbi:MAG: S9 family peptidase [Planctomycetes bacterium]|nr:S9 family peptidase [Planctomycetota bacterium]